MLIILWQGMGWLVFVIIFLSSLFFELTSELITGDDSYYQDNRLLFVISLVVSAILINYANIRLEKKEPQILIDKKTKKEILLQSKNTLFFINMKYWTYIVWALILGFLIDFFVKNIIL